MTERKLPKRIYQAIALTLLAPVAVAVVALGPVAGRGLREVAPALPTLATVLGHVLVLLGATVGWALVVLPLRVRSEMVPLREDWSTVQRRGGLAATVAAERTRLYADADADDPARRARYFGRMTLGGAIVSVAAIAVTWLMWKEGAYPLGVLAIAAVTPGLTLYWAVRYLVARGQATRRPPTGRT